MKKTMLSPITYFTIVTVKMQKINTVRVSMTIQIVTQCFDTMADLNMISINPFSTEGSKSAKKK